MGKAIVIKIGGSLLFKDNNRIDSDKILEFCNIIKNKDKLNNLIVICGGGIIARDYINAVRNFTTNEALCDTFGIDISRLNSRLLISSLGDVSYPQVPKSMEELSIALLFNKIIIMGGLQPGQSTTSVAIEVAELVKADELVILTNVDGIYDKDPKKSKDANLLPHLNYAQLEELILKDTGNKQAAAGEYRIFDLVSLQILKRSNITLLLMNGSNLTQFKNYYNGQRLTIGTRISK